MVQLTDMVSRAGVVARCTQGGRAGTGVAGWVPCTGYWVQMGTGYRLATGPGWLLAAGLGWLLATGPKDGYWLLATGPKAGYWPYGWLLALGWLLAAGVWSGLV